jgi:hypothetical protein
MTNIYNRSFLYDKVYHESSRLSAVEADGCQVSRPLRGLHDFIPTACVRNMRHGEGAWHVDLGVGEERRPRTAWRGPGRSMTAC